jgi:L-alanine-DL-glutamate epimerase and related enzymes of enolase superfamily
VTLESIRASALTIPFNVAFRHASAERAATQTLWVEARSRDGLIGYGEGCPREYVTAESLQSAQAFVSAHLNDWLGKIRDLNTLADWVERHRGSIDRNSSAWAGVELALFDLMGKAGGQSVESLLGLPELAERFRYTAVLGDASLRQFETQLAHYLKAGFRDFKTKLSGDRARDLAKVQAFLSAGISPQTVRADANNLWSEAQDAVRYLEALGFPFFALEEPLRAGDYQGMERISRALDLKIILDESLLRTDQIGRLGKLLDRCIVNLRVSKIGGLLRSLELVREVRRHGINVIVGAHVGETSVLTRAALTIASSARDILLAQEGAFGTHLLAYDVTEPPLMFGPAGVLDAAVLGISGAPGFGLAVSGPVLQPVIGGRTPA